MADPADLAGQPVTGAARVGNCVGILALERRAGREAHLADSSPQTAGSPLEGNVSPGRHKGGDIHLNRHC